MPLLAHAVSICFFPSRHWLALRAYAPSPHAIGSRCGHMLRAGGQARHQAGAVRRRARPGVLRAREEGDSPSAPLDSPSVAMNSPPPLCSGSFHPPEQSVLRPMGVFTRPNYPPKR
eukprot:9484029-Pyramimonas_sp.AAC.1